MADAQAILSKLSRLDTGGDGMVESVAFLQVLSKMGLRDCDVRPLIDTSNAEKDGRVDIRLFISWLLSGKNFAVCLGDASAHTVKRVIIQLFDKLGPAQLEKMRQPVERAACHLLGGLAATEPQSKDIPTFVRVLADADPATVKLAVVKLLQQLTAPEYEILLQALEEAANQLLTSGM
eukprot:TRINITY_DN106508_c0_g1_i1.p1 TRINITY_DN106508_c0_g1~~TRINITY_DN106508_c0_g1_i1.p1  ORF type:complete len:178 (+),score=50.17 TRINITY_DN106508_c0_g1_i1:36-569(+)